VDLLSIAFYLSVLTYYLGVLIYMLPIPIYGLKKWAPQLMVDGVFSAILVFSYSLIMWLIQYFSGILGSDWNRYNEWLLKEINIIIGVILLFKAIGIGLSSMGLGFLANSLLSPLISSLTYLLVFLLTVSTLVYALYLLSHTLVAVGLVLHSIPFRITRSSGAMLISIVIIFSIGAPLMPSFVDLISNNVVEQINENKYGVVYADIIVTDLVNNDISHSVVEFRGMDQNLLARYLADIAGYVDSSDIDKGIPSEKTYMSIDIVGYKYSFIITPEDLIEKKDNKLVLPIKLSNVISIKPLHYMIFMGFHGNISIVSITNSSGTIMVSSSTEYVLLLILPIWDSGEIVLDNSSIEPNNVVEYKWGDVDFKAYKYIISLGNHTISYEVRGNYYSKPVIDEVYYTRDTLGISIDKPVYFINIVSSLIYRVFIGPIVYVSILFTASTALAKLLGGSSSKIARIVVTGV